MCCPTGIPRHTFSGWSEQNFVNAHMAELWELKDISYIFAHGQLMQQSTNCSQHTHLRSSCRTAGISSQSNCALFKHTHTDIGLSYVPSPGTQYTRNVQSAAQSIAHIRQGWGNLSRGTAQERSTFLTRAPAQHTLQTKALHRLELGVPHFTWITLTRNGARSFLGYGCRESSITTIPKSLYPAQTCAVPYFMLHKSLDINISSSALLYFFLRWGSISIFVLSFIQVCGMFCITILSF